MGPTEERAKEISRAAEMADIFLMARKDTLIMTSRELITGKSKFYPLIDFVHHMQEKNTTISLVVASFDLPEHQFFLP